MSKEIQTYFKFVLLELQVKMGFYQVSKIFYTFALLPNGTNLYLQI